MKISRGLLHVHLNDGKKETFGLKSFSAEFHNSTESSCFSCHDFTAEASDISIGNIGSDSRYNTVLVRTDKGLKAFKKAVENGHLEARAATKENLKPVIEFAWAKKFRGLDEQVHRFKPGRFLEYEPSDWNVDEYNYTPEVHLELYNRKHYEVRVLNKPPSGGPKILIAKTPPASKGDLTTFNYSTAYDLTYNLLKDHEKVNGGKIFIKPNNTGFVGIFKHNPKLAPILERNKITDDADHQPIATQPATLKGIVDALLDLGAKKIHIGENMLWTGGTRRAFYETGYCEVFSRDEYRGKVFFVDFCEDDPPPSEYLKLKIKKGRYDISSYYKHFYPPRAFFEEKYDLIFIASIAKSHNCSYYSLMVKNFSVSLNPRRKTGKIEPRWHIHGLPINVFRKDYLKELLGHDFRRKFQYLVRETYPHIWFSHNKERIVKPTKAKIILSGRSTSAVFKSIPATLHSSGLMAWFKSYGQRVLNVDPHHWTGVNLLVMNLGMGYLVTRFTGMYAAIVEALKKNGTEVAGLVTGIVGQEGDGPLIYGNTKNGGFAVAGFDAAAVEKVCLDIMFGNGGDFRKSIVDYQKKLMEKYGIKNALLIDEAERMWTLELLADLTCGVIDNNKMDISLLDYTGSIDFKTLDAGSLFKLRNGPPFTFSEAFYSSPDTWLKLIHTDPDLFQKAFWYILKSIEIPLIPAVVD